VTLRRYAPMTPSAGTRIPTAMRLRVLRRDERATGGCVGFQRLPGDCMGGLELDHWAKDGKDMPPYKRLSIERIVTPEFTLPASDSGGPAPDLEAAEPATVAPGQEGFDLSDEALGVAS
jgi:hypothetical protein